MTLRRQVARAAALLLAAAAAAAGATPPGLTAFDNGNGLQLAKRASGGLPMGWTFEVVRHQPLPLTFADERSPAWVSAGVGTALLDHLSFSARFVQPLDRVRSRQISVGLKLQF